MNNKNYIPLTPFKGWVLENFPFIEANFDAITNYELLCKIIEYINKMSSQFNDIINNLDYLNNWFNNLDVQDEINNKLDDMVESGELQEIIAQYLNANALWCFDNVANMKSATNLIDGSYAKTLGYYSIDDKGAGVYKIREITNADTVDDGSIIGLNDPSLVAELITLDYVNVKCFGAKGDNETDDYQVINKALSYAKSKNLKLYFPEGEYICNNTLTININHFELYGDGKNKTIIHFDKDNSVMFDFQSMWIYFHDIQFYGSWSKIQTCIKNINTNNRSARNRLENLKIRNFQEGIYFSNYSDCNVLRGIDFHLVGQCIYIKQNDNGIIEDCTAEPFTKVFCELHQPNACAVRNCLVNTSSDSFNTQPSTAFIITGNQTGGDGEHYGACVTIENIHSEYIHQFALIGISDVTINDVFIFNNNKTTTLNMFHYINYSGNPINNCNLNNIWIDKTNYSSGHYGIYKANYSENSITAPNGKTYPIAVSQFNNLKVNGFNSTVGIVDQLGTGVYTDYEITNNRVTLKNSVLTIRDNTVAVPSITASNVNTTYYTFGKSIDNSTIFEGRKFKFKYDSTNSSWTPYNIYSPQNLQGSSVTYTPLTKDGTILLSIEAKETGKYSNIIAVMREGLVKAITEIGSNGVTTAINGDNSGITITATSYQNPWYITENVINKNLF